MQPFITVGTSAPGRMTPNSALCFLLSSTLALTFLRPPSVRRDMFMGVFATLIIGLSSVAAAGYARGI